ncbi:glycosyltransferase family 4 protein [Mucilaginibacter lacusdianchii]|uniref:glycosyltransferase family 4 protein n=1 Tax=Mucilaginibacter lacusdianchii TaxID=2684211 RepID=UPI00131DEB58|nr:glycosyltransferase [Mucilaginibacter sp. JXJ CY 39]
MNKPLNIVFFPHSANYGLAGTNRLQNIIYHLKLNHPDIEIANIALEDESKLLSKEQAELYVPKYKELYYGPSVKQFVKHIPQTFSYLRKFKVAGRKNVIYFYGEVDIKNFFFVLWAKSLGYKVVIDIVEDLDTYTQYKSFKNRIKYKSAVFFRQRLNLFADGFTAVSRHLEQKIKGLFKKTPVFFLPVTINKYLLNAIDPNAENQGATTIFYSGSFNEKDGLVFLLKALQGVKAKGKAFRFLLSGKGSDKEMENFWTKVKQYDLEQEINYLGFLTRANYIQILTTEADILCMTRINSAYANAGFPFKLGEFLVTGKPVIASKIADVESYLTFESAWLVEPENADDICKAILEIMDNPHMAKKVGENGRKAALKYFDHANYADALERFIETV